MDLFIKISLLVVYFAVIIYVGFRSRKKASSVKGYVLGGRSAGPWLSAFAYGTSYFSAVIFVGYAGQFGWNFGVAATWIGIGNALIGSFLAWFVLGRRTRLMSQKLDSSTMPDFFGKRYSSNAVKIAAAIIIFVFLIPYSASLYNGLGQLFTMAFGIPFEVCILVMAVVTAVYVLLGGYIASAWNDFIQGIIMLGGIVAVIWAVMLDNGGISAAFASLGEIADGAYTSVLGPDVYSLIMVILLTSVGTWGLPQMVQKFYAIKNESAIKKGMIISTIFALIVAGGCYFLGGFGRLYSGELGDPVAYDTIIPTMLENLPVLIVAIVVVLVVSASMSTLSSLVMSSGSTVTLDLIKSYVKKDMTDRQQVFNIRVMVAIFIAVSAVIAILQYNFSISFIAQMMGVSWGALAGAFLAPYMLSLFCKKVTKTACLCTFGFAVIMSTLSMIFTLSGITFSADTNLFMYAVFGSSIFTGVWTMAMGFVIVPIVSMFTKKPDGKNVNEIFKCYKEKAVEESDEDYESIENA